MPNAGQLLYAAVIGGRMQIFAISRNGGAPRQLTRDDANMMHPAISRDGRLLGATRVLWKKQLRRIRLGG